MIKKICDLSWIIVVAGFALLISLPLLPFWLIYGRPSLEGRRHSRGYHKEKGK
jgi:hypothetical protein